MSEDILLPASASRAKQLCVATAASIGSLLMGVSVSWSGAAITLLQQSQSDQAIVESDHFLSDSHNIVLTADEISWIAALMPLGACVGSLAGSVVNGRIGRKTALLCYSAMFCAAYVLLTVANSVAALYAGRLISGLAAGLTTTTTPLYLAEIAEPHLRGLIGSVFQTMVTVGILIIDTVAYVSDSWRWMSAFTVGICLIWALVLAWMPESPVYLLSRRQLELARRSLTRLRSSVSLVSVECDVDPELAVLQRQVNSADEDQSPRRQSLQYVSLVAAPCSPSPLRRAMTAAYILMIGQQLSGINAVLFYSVDIFEAAHTGLNSFMENMAIAVILLIGTVASATQLDKWGRRPLLLVSAIGSSFSIYALGVYFWYSSDSGDSSGVDSNAWPLIFLATFFLSFSVGLGPVPWLMIGEIFPLEAKSRASSLSSALNWASAVVVTKFFPHLVQLAGRAVAFWTFSVSSTIILGLIVKFIPETRGLPLERVTELFD